MKGYAIKYADEILCVALDEESAWKEAGHSKAFTCVPVAITELSGQEGEDARDAERLRGGLQWYADGNHVAFDSLDHDRLWTEEEGWLCPPTDDAWMVEPGYVAKAILSGRAINPDTTADDITIDAAIAKEKS